MGIKRFIAGFWAKRRASKIREEANNAMHIQQHLLKDLILEATNTEFGRAHRFGNVHHYLDFRQNVPVNDYEQGRVFFDRMTEGMKDVNWPGKPLYLAKTSGTISGAKFIPITKDSIKFQISSARDALLLYIAETGKSDFLDGKMMFLSGSPEVIQNKTKMKIGRLSGIVNHFVPSYLTANRIPTYQTNCIEDWEKKVDKILDEAIGQDLRLISGIPPWVQMLFERLKERTGKKPLEVWPKLHIFAHGGLDFAPYKPIFDELLEGKVDYLELYPASEGFFALQDKFPDEGLLLNINAGIFYEFIPVEEYGKADATRVPLWEIELDKQYAIIVSSNAGLWAYDIGDTVKFVSKKPYRLRVTGRIKHFISAFGEHVISEEVNKAILAACDKTKAKIQEFTVAPFLSEEKGSSFHEWWVEFQEEPEDERIFAQTLDEELRKQNAYYSELRKGNMLKSAKLMKLKLNASREYMKSIGKLGGQNKFPRLSNDRKIVDFLANFVKA